MSAGELKMIDIFASIASYSVGKGNHYIVLLDEPINAIDQSGINSVRTIINNLKSKGSIVIVACHDKEELENLSDEIYTLFEGEIVGHRLVVNNGEKE